MRCGSIPRRATSAFLRDNTTMNHIDDLIRKNPGPSPLLLRIDQPGGRRLELAASAQFSVNAADSLLESLRPWM